MSSFTATVDDLRFEPLTQGPVVYPVLHGNTKAQSLLEAFAELRAGPTAADQERIRRKYAPPPVRNNTR